MSSRTGTFRPMARAAAALALACGGLTAGVGPAAAATAHPAATAAHPAADTTSRVEFHKWTTQADFASGTGNGVEDLSGDRTGIDIAATAGSLTYKDAYLHTTRTYGYATWISPVQAPSFGATELVASWDAQTPAG